MRLHGLDIARFLAFAGMVPVNFRAVANPPEPSNDFATFFTLAIQAAPPRFSSCWQVSG